MLPLTKKDVFFVPINDYRKIRYLIDIYLGFNKQKVTVSLDTGSFSLWVPRDLYNPFSPNTSIDTGHSYSIRYADGSGIKGKYFQDTKSFSLMGVSIPYFHFGRSNLAGGRGTLGIASRKVGAEKNSSLIWNMYDCDQIPKASYSLYLGPSLKSGFIIFGGIDTKKFDGPLVKCNVSGVGLGSSLRMKSINLDGQVFLQKSTYVLDSGTSFIFVSKELMEVLDQIFNVSLHNGRRVVSCVQPSDRYIDFDFGNNTIRVPFTLAVAQVAPNECWLGFRYRKGVHILGDVFLRNAYVYYDYSEQAISLAQAKYSNESNIVVL